MAGLGHEDPSTFENAREGKKSSKEMQEKRLLTAQASELGRVDIVKLMQQDDAWTKIPVEARERIYSLLPPPLEGQHDYNAHPLQTPNKAIIARELRLWQDDLASGFETRKWRSESMQDSMNRRGGAENTWRVALAEEHWGKEFGAIHEQVEALKKEKEGVRASDVSRNSEDAADEAEERLKKSHE